MAVENLKRLHQAVGERISVIQTNGTDFGTQNGPFCSPEQYRELFLPCQKRVNGWIHANTNWKTFMHSCGSIRFQSKPMNMNRDTSKKAKALNRGSL